MKKMKKILFSALTLICGALAFASGNTAHATIVGQTVLSEITTSMPNSSSFRMNVEQGRLYLINYLNMYKDAATYNVGTSLASDFGLFTNGWSSFVAKNTTKTAIYPLLDSTGRLNNSLFTNLGVSVPVNVTNVYKPSSSSFSYDKCVTVTFRAQQTGTMVVTGGDIYNVYSRSAYVLENYDGTSPIISQNGDIFATNINNPTPLATFKSQITATDNVDGNITSKLLFESNYNESNCSVGEYWLKASVSDTSGNTTEVTYKIIVIDNTAPVWSGKTSYRIELGVDSALTLDAIKAGLSCVDNANVDSSQWAVTDGYSSNKGKLGTYIITFSYTDPSGNPSACHVTIENVDTTKPTWTGATEFTTEVKNALTSNEILASISCNDNVDGAVAQAKWTITDGYNSTYNTIGDYTIILSYTDGAGNASTHSIVVHVVDTTKPVITGDLEVSSGMALTNGQILALFSYSDNYTATAQLKITIKSTNFVDKRGTYQYVISCIDGAGNEALATLVFHYIDDEAPVIYATGTIRVPSDVELTHDNLITIMESLGLLEPATYKAVTFESDYFSMTSLDGDYSVKAMVRMMDDTEIEKVVKLNVFSAYEEPEEPEQPEIEKRGFWEGFSLFFKIVFNFDKNYQDSGFTGFFKGFGKRVSTAWNICTNKIAYVLGTDFKNRLI